MNYLLLASWQIIRVKISTLQGGKEQLTWRCIIAVGSGKTHRDAEPPQMVLDLGLLMVTGSIEQYHGILPEVGPVPL
jgi:hypothetical protein